MKTLVFIFSVVIIHTQLNAQQIWKDYIIGRPMSGYAEAKQMTAKEWGIQYEIILAGCVISDKVSTQVKKHQKNNAAYFKTLEVKFGANWMKTFNLDVKKKMNLQQAKNETRILHEVITRPENNDFYTVKKEVAKKWGINYDPRFVKGTISDEYKTSLQRDMVASNEYERHLNNIFGNDWKETFEQEVLLAVAQKKASLLPKSEETIWIDCVIGKPNTIFFDAKKAVAKEWGINYEARFMGCNRTKVQQKEQEKINQQNKAYFTLLAKEYGANWGVLFDRAVQKELIKKQAITQK